MDSGKVHSVDLDEDAQLTLVKLLCQMVRGLPILLNRNLIETIYFYQLLFPLWEAVLLIHQRCSKAWVGKTSSIIENWL